MSIDDMDPERLSLPSNEDIHSDSAPLHQELAQDILAESEDVAMQLPDLANAHDSDAESATPSSPTASPFSSSSSFALPDFSEDEDSDSTELESEGSDQVPSGAPKREDHPVLSGTTGILCYLF